MQPRPPRYAIERPVNYRIRTPAGPLEGAGRTLNISRRGVLFESDQELAVGKKIDLVINMGDAGGAPDPVNMYVQGVTVRNQGSSVAVSIKKYKLRAEASGAVAEA